MKYLRNFESFTDVFDLGNYPVDPKEKEVECQPCEDQIEDDVANNDSEETEDSELETPSRLWGDEQVVESRLPRKFRK